MFFVQFLRNARSIMVHKTNGPPAGSPKFDIRMSAGTFGSGLPACQAALVSCKHPGFNSRKNAECKQLRKADFQACAGFAWPVMGGGT